MLRILIRSPAFAKASTPAKANALLLSHCLAPLSCRSVDEEEYRSAALVFYELNSIMPIKKSSSASTNPPPKTRR